jgi:3',5'-cyclic AMP phosphodiesterase CpdA
MAHGMPRFTIAHITDTHLSAVHPQFVANFEATVGALNRLGPELVINTGDLTVDGAVREGDHAHARALHQRIAAPWRVLPGNHDLGDNPPGTGDPGDSLICAASRQRHRAHWGEDFWALDTGEFRLIGLNAQLCGSGLEAEADQWEFLADEARQLGDRPLCLFIHKPLFLSQPDETQVSDKVLVPAARHRLLDILRGASLKLVASGHLHRHRLVQVGPTLHAWGPSTAFVFPSRQQPSLGVMQVGHFLYHFKGDAVEAELVVPPGVFNHDLRNFPQPYGPIDPGARAANPLDSSS